MYNNTNTSKYQPLCNRFEQQVQKVCSASLTMRDMKINKKSDFLSHQIT